MRQSSRLIAYLLIALSAIALLTYVRGWTLIGSPLDRTSDFAGSYIAASLWRDGQGAKVYDVPTEEAALHATGAPTTNDYIPFLNPPAAILAALPTTLVDGGTAWRIWSWFQLLLVAAAILIAARASPWPPRTALANVAVSALALAATGTGILFIEGQWDGLSVLGLAGAYAFWRRDRSLLAGLVLALGCGIAKPHLVAGLALFVLGRRDWKAVLGAAAGVAVLVAVSLLMVGPSGLALYVETLAKPSYSPIAQMVGLSGMFGSLLGAHGLAYLLTAIGFVACVALAALLGDRARRRPDLLEPALATATLLSLLAAPHLLGHDLTLLAPALVWTCARLAQRHPARWPDATTMILLGLWLILSWTSRVDLGQNGVGFPGRLTPYVLIVAAAIGVAGVLRASAGSVAARRAVPDPAV